MLRAKEQMGTDDIVKIVRNYQGKAFGFASRNFYVSFLAALEVDRNFERYFGHLERKPAPATQTVRVPFRVPVPVLARAVGTDRDTLKDLNLSLLDPVWKGRRYVPKGYDLRVPADASPEKILARLGVEVSEHRATAPTHKVRRGETLEQIAAQYGVSLLDLVSLNHLRGAHVKPGMVVRLPAPSQAAVVESHSGAGQ
jgi:membrane-bound lytic murein transglycosylase D